MAASVATTFACATSISMAARDSYETAYEGVIPNLQRRYRETTSEYIRSEYLERYMTNRPCPTCGGKRLRVEALAVLVDDRNIDDITRMSSSALPWSRGWRPRNMAERGPLPGRTLQRSLAPCQRNRPAGPPLSQRDWTIARQILKEIQARLQFMYDVGLDYLTVNRQAATLSGGEAQRIRLATQIGSQLMGVLYILDEPSIGLHQRDNARLIRTLCDLRNLGNTVLVVEHDEETMRAADWLLDLGRARANTAARSSAPRRHARRGGRGDSLTAHTCRGE